MYETFGGKVTSDAARRRLELVLELSAHSEAVARREIPALSPMLTVAYAGTERMLSRGAPTLSSGWGSSSPQPADSGGPDGSGFSPSARYATRVEDSKIVVYQSSVDA